MISALKFNSGRPERLALFALLILGLLAYVDCLSSRMVFDDLEYINARTFGQGILGWLTPSNESPIKGRPLVSFTLFVNFLLCGDKPAGYHLFNMLVHFGCACMLFGVVRRALLHWQSERDQRGEAIGFAFACSLVWMIHPLQTECVNYVSQRTESMAGLFILTSLYCAIRAYESSHRWRWIVAAGVASWAGVMCKEIAAIGPLLIVMFDFSFTTQPKRELLRDRWRVYTAVFSSWFPLAALMVTAPRTGTVGTNGSVTILQYALNQSVLLVQYLRLVFWPDTLLIDYGRPRDFPWLEVVPAVIAVISLLTLTLVIHRRRPVVGYLGLSAFLLLAPTSSIIPINTEVGAERRMYLPLAAIVVLVVLGVRELVAWSFRQNRRDDALSPCHPATRSPYPWQHILLHGVLLALVVVPLGYRTIHRNRDYANPLKLWTQAVEAHPDNARAWSWMSREFFAIDRGTSERVTSEIASRWANDSKVLFPVGELFLGLHENHAKAAECYRRVLELDPTHPMARLRLVWLLAATGDKELQNGQAALELANSLCEEYPREVQILDALGIAQAECGDFEAAIATTETAIDLARTAGTGTIELEFRIDLYRRNEPFRFTAPATSAATSPEASEA